MFLRQNFQGSSADSSARVFVFFLKFSSKQAITWSKGRRWPAADVTAIILLVRTRVRWRSSPDKSSEHLEWIQRTWWSLPLRRQSSCTAWNIPCHASSQEHSLNAGSYSMTFLDIRRIQSGQFVILAWLLCWLSCSFYSLKILLMVEILSFFLLFSAFAALSCVVSNEKRSRQPITFVDSKSQPCGHLRGKCRRQVSQPFTVSSGHVERGDSAVSFHALCSAGVCAYDGRRITQTARSLDGHFEKCRKEQS